MTPVPILLYGATGRMGRAIRAEMGGASDLDLAACVARASDDHPVPAGCRWLTPDDLETGRALASLPADLVVVDVSLAAGTERLVAALEATPRALLAATTGLDAAIEGKLETLARRAPVLRASNLSLGIAVLRAMIRALPPAARDAYDADLVEHHHAGKKDAPSGTARSLAELLAGVGSPRRPDGGGVPIRSIRGGTVPGTHEVILSGEGETLTLAHAVHDRAVFARGALRAARFLRGRAPGRYSFDDVLN